MTTKGEQWARFDREAAKRLRTATEEVIDDGRSAQAQEQSLMGEWIRLSVGDDFVPDDPVAWRIVLGLGQWGQRCALRDCDRRETGLFLHAATGRRLNVPTHGHIPLRDAGGAALRETQAKLWYEMTWEEFDAWVALHLRLADSVRLKTRGIRQVQAYHAQFPEAETPGEACRLAGVDPMALQLTGS